ncbi:MAG: lysoplasmalogenase [Candidatus Thorarchaeota archaeon]|nr:lysoplasmalogenase [Candidatus Thorarchaeota archaeon]
MSLEIYSAVFWIVAIVSTYLQDKAASSGEKKVASPTTLIKMIPALSAVIFVILYRPPTLFTILLTAALVFCMFGDVGMEIDLVPGIGMFLLAHILYTVNFMWQSSIAGLTLIPLALFASCLVLGVVYVFMLIRYLRASGPEIPPFILRAGTLYFFIIAATLSTSLLLWQTTGVLLGFLPVIGALFFVVSDSFIGINEFHHKLGRHEFYIMPTYYLAIFLLSLGVFVFVF